MPKYVVLYTAPVSASQQMGNNDPAMAEQVMKAWNDWSAGVGEGMVDLGTPLGGGMKVTSSGSSEAGTQVAGYSIINADSMEKAIGHMKAHPHLQMPGASIEVYEALAIPGV